MNLLLLPGNSPKNKEWIDGLAEAFKDSFDEVKAVHYGHWMTGEKIGNLEIEIDYSLYRDDSAFGLIGCLLSVFSGSISWYCLN